MNGKKSKPGELELAGGREKAVEVGQAVGEAVAHAFDAIEGDSAHGGEARDGGGFHIDEGRVVGRGEAILLRGVGDCWAGGKPECAGTGIAVEALTGADVDDSGDIVCGPGSDCGAKRTGPSYGEDKINWPARFDRGEGARCGGLACTG